jgi:hypothetical protein
MQPSGGSNQGARPLLSPRSPDRVSALAFGGMLGTVGPSEISQAVHNAHYKVK